MHFGHYHFPYIHQFITFCRVLIKANIQYFLEQVLNKWVACNLLKLWAIWWEKGLARTFTWSNEAWWSLKNITLNCIFRNRRKCLVHRQSSQYFCLVIARTMARSVQIGHSHQKRSLLWPFKHLASVSRFAILVWWGIYWCSHHGREFIWIWKIPVGPMERLSKSGDTHPCK